MFTPTEAGAAAAGYALVYGLIAKGKAFLLELIPTTIRTMNLTAIVFFLLGCVGVFQFFLANMGWPQDIADWVNSLGLSPIGFLFVLMGTLLVLSMFLTGVAILVLTVPIFFPVALSLGIDPINLGILTALAIEIGSVIPPVGLNLLQSVGLRACRLPRSYEGLFRSATRIQSYSLSCCFSPRLLSGCRTCFKPVIFYKCPVLRFISSVSVDSTGACFSHLV